MRRTKLFVGTLLAAGFVVAFAASKKDPVLMKVDGKPVTLSEFEYMYHKTISSKWRNNRWRNISICLSLIS